MDIGTDRQSAATIVAVTGDIDIHSAPDLESVLERVVRDDAGDVILDLTETTFLDSTALGVLVGIDKQLAPGTRAFKIVCPNPRLQKIFRISHLDRVWPILGSVADAAASTQVFDPSTSGGRT